MNHWGLPPKPKSDYDRAKSLLSWLVLGTFLILALSFAWGLTGCERKLAEVAHSVSCPPVVALATPVNSPDPWPMPDDCPGGQLAFCPSDRKSALRLRIARPTNVQCFDQSCEGLPVCMVEQCEPKDAATGLWYTNYGTVVGRKN